MFNRTQKPRFGWTVNADLKCSDARRKLATHTSTVCVSSGQPRPLTSPPNGPGTPVLVFCDLHMFINWSHKARGWGQSWNIIGTDASSLKLQSPGQVRLHMCSLHIELNTTSDLPHVPDGLTTPWLHLRTEHTDMRRPSSHLTLVKGSNRRTGTC